MEIFINGIGCISPQQSIANRLTDQEIISPEAERLKCIEPVFKEYINPLALRRMSRIVKMGVTAAQVCLKEAEITTPDAIITATGLGCIEDTESFLSSVIINDEKLLNPTPFIQSTHNTIGAQIALLLKCNNYNITYAHRGTAFEHALNDAFLLFKDNEAENVLVGAADEMTDKLFKITRRLNMWKKAPLDHIKLPESKTSGSIAGEGASFFVLSRKKTTGNYAQIKGVDTFYKPESYREIENWIVNFLEKNNQSTEAVDLVVYGLSGNSKTDGIFYHLMEKVFNKNQAAYFKHLSGEYHTANAFAFWLSAMILKNQSVPPFIKLNEKHTGKIGNILLYNHYFNINHSLILLSGC